MIMASAYYCYLFCFDIKKDLCGRELSSCSKRQYFLYFLQGFIFVTLNSVHQLVKYTRITHRSLVQLNIDIPKNLFPYLQRKWRIKWEDHQISIVDKNESLSGTTNAFKIRKLISYQSMPGSWQMWLLFQTELFTDW